MGALISLFVSLLMMMVSVTLSLLMTFINLSVGLLSRGLSRGYHGPRRYATHSTGVAGVVLFAVLGFIVLLAAEPRLAVFLAVVAALALGVWLLLRSSGRYRTMEAAELAHLFQSVRLMSGSQFEAFMANLFRAMGYKANVLGGSGDQGVDVLVEANGQRIAVQCKNYAKPVGNKPVQEVYAGASHHRCSQAWVVAPVGYTRGAVELARSTGVKLYDADSIRAWIRQVDAAAKAREEAVGTPTLDRSDGAVGDGQQRRAIAYPHPDDPNDEATPVREHPLGTKDRLERDREEYDKLLDHYRQNLDVLEQLYADWREHLRAYEANPQLVDRWHGNYKGISANIGDTARKLDLLESHNPELATDERVSRRTALARRQSELEEQTGPQRR